MFENKKKLIIILVVILLLIGAGLAFWFIKKQINPLTSGNDTKSEKDVKIEEALKSNPGIVITKDYPKNLNGLSDKANEANGLSGAEEYDTDHDGLSDKAELKLGTDPKNPDTDGDELSDGQEVIVGTNSLKADTDGDGYTDGVEIKNGFNPIGPGKIK